MWAQNLPELAQNYHVIALDLLGIGQSDKPLIDYKMDTWTDFLNEFLRQKGVTKATMGGESPAVQACSKRTIVTQMLVSPGLVCGCRTCTCSTREVREIS